MADFVDAKHRPHAVHTGEIPRNKITYGPESLWVSLDRWGPQEDLFSSMYDALQANWGEYPSRTVTNAPIHKADDRVNGMWNLQTGWAKLTPDQRDYVEQCFAGKTLQQVLEGVTFDFCIDGVSRAFTHQNVRTRLGAGFMQHGGRDNDWRHRPWTMPETMRRMCDAYEIPGVRSRLEVNGLKHCITNWEPIGRLLEEWSDDPEGRPIGSIREAVGQHILRCRVLYAALVDAGIPWQDARRVLPIGMQTYIHDQYNYLALSGVLANRLEHIMDWEFNCVAQLMLREIKMKCPPLLSKYLGSHSDKAQIAKFAGLESWPPDGKYLNPHERCKTCGHSKANHHLHPDTNDVHICEACERNADPVVGSVHKYVAVDTLPRQHRSEQMPFFVLHPESMAGGPVRWIPTNGQYPHEALRQTESMEDR